MAWIERRRVNTKGQKPSALCSSSKCQRANGGEFYTLTEGGLDSVPLAVSEANRGATGGQPEDHE